MRSLATTRIAGLCATSLLLHLCAGATSAYAAEQGLIINEQILLGDVFSQQTLNVEEASEGLGVTTTAVGNIVSGAGQNSRINFQNAQSVDASVEAATDAQVNGATGEYFATSTSATGNSATAGTCCALTLGASQQWVSQGAVVQADAFSRTGDQAADISVDASAIGNTQGWNQVNGELDAWSQQINSGAAVATNTGQFDSSPGNIGLTSTIVDNNVTADVKNAFMDVGVEQSRFGPGSSATVDAYVDNAVDVQAVATASGNLVDVIASSPDAVLSVGQTGSAGIDAYSNLTLGQWSGDANSVAYGVGNSVVLSNIGAVTTLYTDQSTSGEVNATGSFTGGAGRAVFANSTAIGNAVSGYSCTECGGEFGGFNRQVSGNKVRAQSNVIVTGSAGLISGDSTAIGNTATYHVRSNGDD